jgi:hypothetical protein
LRTPTRGQVEAIDRFEQADDSDLFEVFLFAAAGVAVGELVGQRKEPVHERVPRRRITRAQPREEQLFLARTDPGSRIVG